MVKRTRINGSDLLALAIVWTVQGSAVFALVAQSPKADTSTALIAAIASIAGITAALVVWMLGGRPAADRMLRERPLVAILATALFISGLVPAVIWT
jgi:membrane associated rhomboid family serine protease